MSTRRRGHPLASSRPPVPGGSAEWTKLSSVRSTWWTALAGAAGDGRQRRPTGHLRGQRQHQRRPDRRPGRSSPSADVLIGSVELTQYVVLALACSRSPRVHQRHHPRPRCSAPRRGVGVLLAKAAVVGAVTFALGLLLGGVGALVARPVLGEWGSAPAAGTSATSWRSAPYLALIGVLRPRPRRRAAQRGAPAHRAPRHPDDRAAVAPGAGHRRARTGSPTRSPAWPAGTSWPATPSRTRRRSGCSCSPGWAGRRTAAGPGRAAPTATA